MRRTAGISRPSFGRSRRIELVLFPSLGPGAEPRRLNADELARQLRFSQYANAWETNGWHRFAAALSLHFACPLPADGAELPYLADVPAFTCPIALSEPLTSTRDRLADLVREET